MKFAALMLLLAGWIIVLAAVVLLDSPAPRAGFVLAGMAVEILGLAHPLPFAFCLSPGGSLMPSPAALSEAGTVLCIVFILLVPLAAAGLSLINTGLGRARSAAYAMLTALCVIAIAAGVYFLVGFAIEGYPGTFRARHEHRRTAMELDWRREILSARVQL